MAEEAKGCSGQGSMGMSHLVPGQTLWRTRVRHEVAAAEAFGSSFKPKRPPAKIPDEGYRSAMSTLADFRAEIRAAQDKATPHRPDLVGRAE